VDPSHDRATAGKRAGSQWHGSGRPTCALRLEPAPHVLAARWQREIRTLTRVSDQAMWLDRRGTYSGDVIPSGLSFALAVLAIVISVSSALYTRQQAVEARKAREITEAERHDALTPVFDVTLKPLNSGSNEADIVRLNIKLVGPVGLAPLDDLTIEVRDDSPRTALSAGPSKDEIAVQIWGPYRLSPGIDNATADGRRVAPLSHQRTDGTLPRGESTQLQMERTRPPSWYAPGQKAWEDDFPADHPVKLRLCCRSADHEWVVPVEVQVTGWSPRVY
jgi:hypothetical protein